MRNKIVQRIVIDAMFAAIIAAMSFIPYVGYISVGIISITTIHVVVLIGAYFFGWVEGAIFGFTFGLMSLLKALTMPTSAADYMFVNPLVSILPRVIFGLVAGLVFMAIKKYIFDKKVSTVLIALSSAVLTLFHTCIVILLLWLCYQSEFGSFTNLLTVIFSLNSAVEMALAIVLVPGIGIPVELAVPLITRMSVHEDRRKIDYSYYAKNYMDNAIDSLSRIVSINSEFDEKTSSLENPYGLGVSRVLEEIKLIANQEGFYDVNIYDNRVLELNFGEGKKLISVFAHADVVPASGKWDYEPYKLTEIDDKLYGRGSCDDKGPLIASLYAIKLLKEKGLINKYRVQLVVGGDEERGSSCLEYYFKTLKKPAPTYGFTPDGSFPVVFAEKGIVNYECKKEISLSPVKEIVAGSVINAVIDEARVTLGKDAKFLSYLELNNVEFNVEEKGTDMVVIFKGKAAHGSTPELGINAGLIALQNLGGFYNIPLLNKIYQAYENLNGSGIDVYNSSALVGETTANIGLLSYKDGILSFKVNYRYPEKISIPSVMKKIKSSLDIDVSVLSTSPLLYFKPSSKLISKLMDVYRIEMHDYKAKPLAMGGGTYAKEAKNTVAFGAMKEGVDYHIHEPNEFYGKRELEKSIAMYAHAIYRLGSK